MTLKLVFLTKRLKCIAAILTISLVFGPFVGLVSRRHALHRASECSGTVQKLRVEDGVNPVSVSLVALQFRLVATESDDPSVVPNIVHYVWLSDDLNFSFINYLSFKSVDKFIRPECIFVFGEVLPNTAWWKRVISEIDNVYHVRVDRPRFAPNGKPFRYLAHSSDFLRFNLLSNLGGIYLDSDVLILKSFDRLRQYEMVLGREQPDALCNGIIVARRGAPFLQLILKLYDSYLGDKEDWGYRANRLPHQLALLHPELIHVEETSLNRPNWKESPMIYNGLYNWTSNFAMHLWVRKWPESYRPRGFDDIRTVNTTLGEMARLILYGSSQPLSSL